MRFFYKHYSFLQLLCKIKVMITLEMIEDYKKYLALIEKKLLNKYFEAQKEYIFCKEGCSGCCKSGEYPTSELELMYLMEGYQNLPPDLQAVIAQNSDKIKSHREQSGEKLYQCPFLINNKCSVYEHRLIICRTHGLMYYLPSEDGVIRNKIPACCNDGLNYSQVYDSKQKTITSETWGNSGIKAEPVAYNISREVLTNNSVTKELRLEFGESKALIDWF